MFVCVLTYARWLVIRFHESFISSLRMTRRSLEEILTSEVSYINFNSDGIVINFLFESSSFFNYSNYLLLLIYFVDLLIEEFNTIFDIIYDFLNYSFHCALAKFEH